MGGHPRRVERRALDPPGWGAVGRSAAVDTRLSGLTIAIAQSWAWTDRPPDGSNEHSSGRVPNSTEQQAVSERLDCDRTVIRQAQNLEEHRGLRTHTE